MEIALIITAIAYCFSVSFVVFVLSRHLKSLEILLKSSSPEEVKEYKEVLASPKQPKLKKGKEEKDPLADWQAIDEVSYQDIQR